MVAVVDEANILQGIFTDGDLRRLLEKNIAINVPISEVMSKNVKGLAYKQNLAADALVLMQQKKINGIIVIDEARHPLGAFNLHDLMAAGII